MNRKVVIPLAKNVEFSYLLDFYAPVLTDKQRDVTELYYYENLSLAEIADATGITRQGVRDAIKRSEEIIYDLEAKLGFAKWFSLTGKTLDSIEENAKEILSSNRSFIRSERVEEAGRSILDGVANLRPKLESMTPDED